MTLYLSYSVVQDPRPSLHIYAPDRLRAAQTESREDLPLACWSVGMLGLPINVFAFCYCFFVIVFFCIPIEVPVTLAAAKRAPTVWAGVICIALAVYVLHE
jgi:hypothetical protein